MAARRHLATSSDVTDASIGLTEDQMMLQKMAEDFSLNEIAPHAAEWDENKHFPADVLQEAAGLGFGGIFVREESGGAGLSRLDGSVIFEALAQGCTVRQERKEGGPD